MSVASAETLLDIARDHVNAVRWHPNAVPLRSAPPEMVTEACTRGYTAWLLHAISGGALSFEPDDIEAGLENAGLKVISLHTYLGDYLEHPCRLAAIRSIYGPQVLYMGRALMSVPQACVAWVRIGRLLPPNRVDGYAVRMYDIPCVEFERK